MSLLSKANIEGAANKPITWRSLDQIISGAIMPALKALRDRIGKLEDGALSMKQIAAAVTVEYDAERTITFRLTDGTALDGGTIRLPLPIHRGTYDAGRLYEAGDEVTWGGSCWRARSVARNIEPGDDSAASKQTWLLAAMRGRQGKHGGQG